MNLFSHFRDKIRDDILPALAAEGRLPADLAAKGLAVEPPRDPKHGDISANAALVIARAANMKPREVAELIAAKFRADPDVAKVEVAGPGFINLTLADGFWHERLREMLRAGPAYGDCAIGEGRRINVEFVSANPTGPMHVGHVRGAVIGDALSNLLAKAGYAVTREYYFNDAGAQVDVLARTTYLRYREALGEEISAIPEGLYPGEYLKEVGAALARRDGDKWLGRPETEWLAPVRAYAVDFMIRMIKDDLALIGIRHDVFTNERELIENGTLDTAFRILEEKGLIYIGTLPPPKGKTMEDWEAVPLTLFRSSQFGDSTDRPLKKRDGSWAYIMPDMAYHYDMIRRGFRLMINVLGTDHAGYLDRMRPAIAAFSDGKAHLDVVFNGIVKVFLKGEPVKLSKRSGNLITLREMVEEVGAGVVRFFILTRGPEPALDFDFANVVEQSKDNPVFYVQYAHARARSVLRLAASAIPDLQLDPESLARAPLERLRDSAELALIRLLAGWPRLIESAAEAHEPHRLAFYLQELASSFHALWNKGKDEAGLRFIVSDSPEVTQARLALVQAVAFVVASGLQVFGVMPAEEMR